LIVDFQISTPAGVGADKHAPKAALVLAGRKIEVIGSVVGILKSLGSTRRVLGYE